MKKIFIHAGLHKTGTTALQFVFSNNKNNLGLQDSHYPKNGIPNNLHGHHNIAWQLSRDRRFRPEYGTVRELIKEIEETEKRKIILSSEDFESSLMHPQRFQKILEYFLNRGMKVFFVIYLRRQNDYIQSMYSELLKVGFGDEFNSFFRKIASTNKYEFKEWEFLFNYSKIAKSLQSLKDVEVIFRDYHDLDEDNTIVDFCNVIGIDHKKLDISDNRDRLNQRLATSTLLKLFFKNRVSAKPDGILDVVDELLDAEDKILMLPENMDNFCSELASKNLFYKNIKSFNVSIGNRDALNIEKLFSFNTCSLILLLIKLNGKNDRKKQLIEEWRQWVKIGA